MRAIAVAAAALIVAALAGSTWLVRRPQPVPLPFDARDFVLVTAFENRTGEPLLDGTLDYALEQELSNSSFVNVAGRGRVEDALQLMRKAPDSRLDVTVGREVALRDGQIQAMLAGRVEKLGGFYSIGAQVINPTDASIVSSVTETSLTQADLLLAIRRVSIALRERLGEALPTIAASRNKLARVTTPSLRALQLYSQAETMELDGGGWGPKTATAEQLLHEAVREDPGFASAHMRLSVAARLQGALPKALEHAERAMALSDGGTEVERLINQGEYFNVQGLSAADPEIRRQHNERAAAAFAAALELQPDHMRALICLTNLSNRLGKPNPLVAGRMADLRPKSIVLQTRAAAVALSATPPDRASAMRYLQRARQIEPTDRAGAFDLSWAELFDAHEAWLQNNPREALRVVDGVAAKMRSLSGEPLLVFALNLSRAYRTLGQLDRSEELAALVEPNREAKIERVAGMMYRGNPAALRAAIANEFPEPEQVDGLGSTLIEAGLLKRAHKLVASMNIRPQPPVPYMWLVEGQLALAEGRFERAIEKLEQVLPRTHENPPQWMRATLKLAEVWVAKHDNARAIDLLERASSRQIGSQHIPLLWGYTWLSARSRLSELYRKVGRDKDADAVEAELLTLLTVADDDHPIKRRLLQSAATRAAATVVPFKARDWVLVTAADNRTGESLLDGALEYALQRELANSSFFNVVPRERVADALQLMQKPADTRLDLSISREVALRDGAIRALVTPHVEKTGDAYGLSAELRNPADGTIVSSVVEPPVRQSELLAAVTRLALSVRDRLGETLPKIESRQTTLPRLTTTSIQALQLYARVEAMIGPEGWFNGREKAAEQLLREAVDPGFASAHRLLSIAVRLDGERSGESRLPEALEHIERAVRLADSVSQAERIRNEGQLHAVRFFLNPPSPARETHAARAIAACEAMLQLNADDVEALIGCTNFYQLVQEPNARISTRLADLRPNSAVWQVAAARALLADNPGRLERARPYISRARRLPPTNTATANAVAVARLVDAQQAWMRNDPREALRIADAMAAELESLPARPRAGVAEALWRVYVQLGQMNRAAEIAALTGQSQKNALVIVAFYREDREALQTLLKRSFPNVADGAGVGSAYIEAGLFHEAREVLAALQGQSLPGQLLRGPLNISPYILLFEGQLALAEGHAESAIERLEKYMQNHGSRARQGQWMLAARRLADAWIAKGEIHQAIPLLETSSIRRPEVVLLDAAFGSEWLPVRERLAQLYSNVGRITDAKAVEAELTKLLAVADDDHPIKRRLMARDR